jgi:hypothetical protein
MPLVCRFYRNGERGVLQEVSKRFSRRVKGRLSRGNGRLSKEGVISWRR